MSDRSEAYRVSDDLVERVARAACASVNSADTWGETGTDVHEMVWFPIARAAIAVVLEEAAQAAETYHNPTCNCEVCYGHERAAAAIRALVKEPTDPGPASASGS